MPAVSGRFCWYQIRNEPAASRNHPRRPPKADADARPGPGPLARWTLLELTAAGALLVVLVGVAALFAWPWLAEPPLGGPTLDRYVPLRDAASVLVARYDASGELVGWESRNSTLTPWLGLYGEVRQAPNNLLLNFYQTPDDRNIEFQELQRRLRSRAQVITTRVRTLDRAGTVGASTIVGVRDARGEALAGIYTPADNSDTLFDPPLLGLPSDLEVGGEWVSEGGLGRPATPTASRDGSPRPERLPARWELSRIACASRPGSSCRRDRERCGIGAPVAGTARTSGSSSHASMTPCPARRRARCWSAPRAARRRRPCQPCRSRKERGAGVGRARRSRDLGAQPRRACSRHRRRWREHDPAGLDPRRASRSSVAGYAAT